MSSLAEQASNEELASIAYELKARGARIYAESREAMSVAFTYKAKLYAKLANGESVDPEEIKEYHRLWNAPNCSGRWQEEYKIREQKRKVLALLRKRRIRLVEIDICIPPPDSPLKPL